MKLDEAQAILREHGGHYCQRDFVVDGNGNRYATLLFYGTACSCCARETALLMGWTPADWRPSE